MKYLVALIFIAHFIFTAGAASAPEVIKAYMESDKIPRLSTDTNKLCASSRFGFHARLVVPENQAEEHGFVTTDISIETAGNVACIISATNGLPFGYMSESLWVSFSDRSAPGTLMYLDSGNPEFIFGGYKADDLEMRCNIQFGRATKQPKITINVATVFDPAYGPRSPTFDEAARELAFTSTAGAKAYLKLSGRKNDPFGFESIRFDRRVQLIFDAIQPQLVTNRLPRLSKEDFRKTGLPMVSLGTNDLFAPAVPIDFPKNDQERKAAQRLKTLFTKGK